MLYEDKLTLKQRLQRELIYKGLQVGPTYIVFSILFMWYQFGIQKYLGLFLVSTVGILVTAIIRTYLSFLFQKKKCSLEFAFKYTAVIFLVSTLSFFSLFLIVFLQTPVTSVHFASAFTLIAGLTASSVITISYVPLMAIFWQIAILLTAIPVIINEYLNKNSQSNLFLSISLFTFLLYLVKQTLAVHKEFVEKFNHEINLEISLNLLKETNQKALEETFKSSNTEKYIALGELADGVGHEINNPLAIVTGNLNFTANFLSKTNDQELILKKNEIKTRIEKSALAADRIKQIVRSLMKVSKFNSQINEASEFTLEDLILDVKNLTFEKFKNHEINLEINPCPQVVLKLNRPDISQVLLNILNNSFEAFAKLNQSSKILVISFSDAGEKINIAIENNGPKIPNEIKNKIFNPFFTTKEIGAGPGLGLSISKGILNSMGADIWLDEDSINTKFVFSLPIKKNLHQKESA